MNEKNALIVGIKTEKSVGTAIAQKLKGAGYNIYATYPDETVYEGVKSVADSLGINKLFKYDARKDEDLEQLAQAVKAEGILLDSLVHGTSYGTLAGANLHQPLLKVSWDEFADAIRVEAFSLVELSGQLLDIFQEGASILALTQRSSQVAIPNFNVLGSAKAGLESIIRGLAESLGKCKKIKVNGISPGYFDSDSLVQLGDSSELLERAKNRSPLKINVTQADLASLALSILENNSITGTIYTIDCGEEIIANL
jgi:enoyl-[acyl-carrier protein] reductase I